MEQVLNLTSNARQTMQLPIENGNTATFNLYYNPTQYAWYFDLIYNDYEIYGSKVVLHYNIIRQQRNILPFGLAFLAQGNVEPFSIDDFENERVKLFILTQNEVQDVEEYIYNG